MIRKTIYYCWFGNNPISQGIEHCIQSWKRFCPDYEIVKISEENYQIDEKCEFVKKAYQMGKLAFVSDYARLDVIYTNGGIYFDTDVELLRPISDLIADCRGFFGFEQESLINTGIGFSCEKGEPILRRMMEYYEEKDFNEEDLSANACPVINTKVLAESGVKMDGTYQVVNGIKILPTDYLCPENMYSGASTYTHNTISVHHYNASWLPRNEKIRMDVILTIKRYLPKKVTAYLRHFFSKHEKK